MKRKTLVCGAVFFVVMLAFVFSFAEGNEKDCFYVPKPNEEICGTWVNTDYSDPSYEHQKLVIYNWGYWEIYGKLTDADHKDYGTYIIVQKWVDSEGNIWYKSFGREVTGFRYYDLLKISKNGTALESLENAVQWCTEDDMRGKVNGMYSIYYRR